MAEITLQNVRNHIIKGISMNIRDKELLVLIGPSGAGKTTLLNMVAGLIPHDGRILVDGERMDGLSASKRNIGYLFQDLLLFPHMSVKKNIMMALKRLPMNASERNERISSMLELFHLNSLGDRLPGELSGGEKQRVALARALASSPKILLLDEPFSSLDFRTARFLRLELKRIQSRLGITMLFVTHNLEEAQDLGDRMGVMTGGRLEQIGDIQEIMLQGRPSECGFLEKSNVLPCTCQESLGNGLVHVRWADQKLFVPEDGGRSFCRVAIHPRHVYISPYPPPGPQVNRFQGRIREIRHVGGMAQVEVMVGDQRVHAQLTTEQAQALSLSSGDPVYGILKLRDLHGC
ncbi:MAG: ABC transporter ATP-binding protein [Deltaproteobacteria bacterium]|nr:ABC transporter ATP-binding protein [Deltaproteobacteria bacterium]